MTVTISSNPLHHNTGIVKNMPLEHEISKTHVLHGFSVFHIFYNSSWFRGLQRHPRDHTETFWILFSRFDFTRHQKSNCSTCLEFLCRNGPQIITCRPRPPQNSFSFPMSLFPRSSFPNKQHQTESGKLFRHFYPTTFSGNYFRCWDLSETSSSFLNNVFISLTFFLKIRVRLLLKEQT